MPTSPAGLLAPRAQGPGAFCSLLNAQCLALCLAHWGPLMNVGEKNWCPSLVIFGAGHGTWEEWHTTPGLSSPKGHYLVSWFSSCFPRALGSLDLKLEPLSHCKEGPFLYLCTLLSLGPRQAFKRLKAAQCENSLSIQSLHFTDKETHRKQRNGERWLKTKKKKYMSEKGIALSHFPPYSPSPSFQKAHRGLFSLLQEFTVRNIQAGLETKATWRDVRGSVRKRNLQARRWHWGSWW